MNDHRYIKEFLSLKCAPDLLALQLFPKGSAAKEITESMAAFHAVKYVLPDWSALGDHDMGLVSVGDGHTPRTAALFAYRTAWRCYSVDPLLRDKSYPISRLSIHRQKIEDFKLDRSFKTLIIVMVHSHATIKATLTALAAPTRHLIAIPCCVPQEIPNVPYTGYYDQNIWSPKNTVKLWKNV